MNVEALYEDWNRLSESEKSFVAKHPIHSWKIREKKKIAEKETRNRFGTSGHNDRSDAFRHCYWTALIANEIGVQAAREFTTLHESAPGNPIREKEMDLHNNAVGVRIGQQFSSDKAIADRCFEALERGDLRVPESMP